MLKLSLDDKTEIRRMAANQPEALIERIIQYIGKNQETGDITPGYEANFETNK